VPGGVGRLTDVDEPGPGAQEALELAVLIAVGRVDVDVQPGTLLLRLVVANEEDRRLRSAEPLAGADLDVGPLFAVELDEVKDLAPELAGGRTWIRRAPVSGNKLGTVPDQASVVELISGTSGSQPKCPAMTPSRVIRAPRCTDRGR
jgi:hypothetical protein